MGSTAETPFLSTLSLRRATAFRKLAKHVIADFYPRSPCGERPADRVALQLGILISIHALLAESDLGIAPLCQAVIISIHALLAESDPNFTVAR